MWSYVLMYKKWRPDLHRPEPNRDGKGDNKLLENHFRRRPLEDHRENAKSVSKPSVYTYSQAHKDDTLSYVQLDASRIRLEEAQSARAVTRVKQDVASLQSAVAAVEKEEFAASLGIQQVSGRFQNVTETWEGSLAVVMADLVELKAESRTSHGRMMESVNEADQQLLALAERMEELEDSTRRNARAFERTEEDDAQRVQGQLDWNTQQVAKLQDRLAQLAQQDAELLLKLEEHVPRARKCEEQLPVVEEAVRSILRLSAGLSSTERRVEEVSLQVLGLEDSMLKGLSQALELRQELDALQMHDNLCAMNPLQFVTTITGDKNTTHDDQGRVW
uniref:IKBKB interacting protein n=1 Tax=Denticeps clupeoides TaxID=299321 RepID=A0AAY4EWZ4_9TELE